MAVNTNIITYNQVLSLFREFATKHLNVNEFDSGNLYEIAEREGSVMADYSYPLMFVEDQPFSTSTNTLTYSFDIILMDIVHSKDGNDYEPEIKSDMMSVALDLQAYIKVNPLLGSDSVRLVLDDSGTIVTFKRRFDDNVAGVILSISMTQPVNYDKCSIPNTDNI